MANIVLAIYNPLIRQNGMFPYFEALLDGLKKAGNNILCFEKTSVELNLNDEIPKEYLEKIKDFKPDLFIFFNNQFWDITKYFDSPIIIYDVDSPNVFCNIEKLKKNKRYKYLTIQKSNINLIKEILEDNSIEVQYIPPFTGVVAENKKQDINVAFCGSHWLWNDFRQVEDFLNKKPSKQEREIAKEVYSAFLNYPFKNSDEIYKKMSNGATKKLEFDNLFVFSTRLSGIKRLRTLLEIESLGLEIRGYFWNCPDSTPLKAYPELLLSYSDEVVNNLKTTQEFYNSAKIGFNVNHIQAQSGFSWRVFDILASNACLVTEYSSDLEDFDFDILTYKTKEEAKEICKRLLENEDIRKEYVENAHKFIEKNHRFNSILPVIEEIAGLKLSSDKNGQAEVIRTDVATFGQKACYNKGQFPSIDKTALNRWNKILYKISRYLYKKIKVKKSE